MVVASIVGMSEEIICGQIAAILGDILDEAPAAAGIHADTSVLELGLDSITIIDLAVELEDRLAIDHFPIQEWADAEAAAAPPRFTVGSLARMCQRLQAQEAS